MLSLDFELAVAVVVVHVRMVAANGGVKVSTG